MKPTIWEQALVKPKEENSLWELFHENSKLTPYSDSPSDEEIIKHMEDLQDSLPFDGYPIVPLPDSPLSLVTSLGEAMTSRSSAPRFEPIELSLEQVGTLLFFAYGITRPNHGTSFPRPFRTVPSAGAMYPLDIFFHTTHTQGLRPGLYYYNPSKNVVRLLHESDDTDTLCQASVYPDNVRGAALQIFLTGLFERTTFKYGNRGYRFVLMEAGHVAQNLNLAATALGLGCLNVGGFLDREMDAYLGLDGITHSTLYATLIGGKA